MNPSPITAQHLNNLAKLYADVFNANPWNEHWEHQWALDRLSNILQCPHYKGFLIEQDSEIIGAIMGRGNTFQGNKEFEICEFFINPADQGNGVGSMLFNILLEELHQEEYKLITLLTSRKVPAMDFYTNKGFQLSKDIVFMHKSIG